MDNKIVEVKFEEGRESAKDFSLKQWSYGHVLQITGLTIPDGDVEVHFSLTENNGSATVHIGIVKDNVITVDIPDYLLAKENTNQPTYDAWAWIYLTDEESGRTVRKITFTVETRAKPTTDVPEAQQDQFLQEVRQVMAETKEIAQSVRADADNGEFDGEKGEKGDAGSIKFVIVTELPTENIDTSAIYLLPFTEAKKDEDGNLAFNNNFHEYIYVNGAWECIGSASVEVKLDDYVKKDDYATNSGGHGTVGVKLDRGLIMNSSDGIIAVNRATNSDIDTKKHDYKPIVPSTLDYSVMKALSDSKLEWTDEQKQLARALLGSVGSGDYATSDNGGTTKVNSVFGLNMFPTTNATWKGHIYINKATNKDIDEKTNVYKPIVSSNLDYAVKKALSDCKLEGDDVWTEEEKAKALELLGAVNVTNVKVGEVANSIAKRGVGGTLSVGTPTNKNSATTKKYVDDLVGSVQSILTELHAHAQTKIGGEA